jgi:hypothetical protein
MGTALREVLPPVPAAAVPRRTDATTSDTSATDGHGEGSKQLIKRGKLNMQWMDITLKDLMSAMDECDNLGLYAFREKYGFRIAKNVHMYRDGRGPYEARPLIAAAHSNRFPLNEKVISQDFTGNDAHEFLKVTFSYEEIRLDQPNCK